MPPTHWRCLARCAGPSDGCVAGFLSALAGWFMDTCQIIFRFPKWEAPALFCAPNYYSGALAPLFWHHVDRLGTLEHLGGPWVASQPHFPPQVPKQ